MSASAHPNRAARDWLENLGAAGRSKETLNQHRRNLDALFDFLLQEGQLPPDQVDFRSLVEIHGHGTLLGVGPVNRLLVEQFLSWACREVENPERRARRRNALLETLHMFFRHLVGADALTLDPTKDVLRAKIRTRVNFRKHLTPVESAALLEAAAHSGTHAPRNLTVMVVLLRSGLRPGEACSLNESALDLTNQVLYVNGKTGNRMVALVPTVSEVLSRYLKSEYHATRSLPSGELFLSDKGDQPLDTDSLRGIVQKLCVCAGIDRGVTTYWTRHTFATDAHRSGVAFPIISQALGHAKLSTTHTYVHSRETRMRQIIERGPATVPLIDVHRALLRSATPLPKPAGSPPVAGRRSVQTSQGPANRKP